MTGKTPPAWQWDWAGPHGTAWGTVNATLTTITLTTTVHAFAPAVRPLHAGVGTAAAVVLVLLRAAVSRRRRPTATVLYQVTCWAGAGTWATWMLTRADWTPRWWGQQVVILAVAAVLAGLLASLAADGPTDPVTGTDDDPDAQESHLTDVNPTDPLQPARVTTALEWEERIRRVSNNVRVEVTHVDFWERGNGYTLRARLPEGGFGLDDLLRLAPALANDADIPDGCRVTPYREAGTGRRDVLLDVSTVNALAEDQHYPQEITQLTVNEPVPIGLRHSFEEETIEMRQKCLLAIGEPGSGKTNFLHVVTGGMLRCVDTVVWGIDLTGGGLFRPWLRPYLEGRANRPAIDAVARDPREALLMTRAALRIGHVRKRAYQELMFAHDDDKLPVGAILDSGEILPELLVMADEIANITGSKSEWPDLRDSISQGINELRASAVRYILAGLRATDDVVIQAIQAMCAVRVGMKMQSRAELAWLFEWGSGLSPEDTPDPGSGFVQHDSASKPTPFRAWRLTPSLIGAIAAATDEWRPGLDPISEAAANGRNLDGTPMLDDTGRPLPDDELDWYARRWEGWDVTAGTPEPMPLPPRPQILPIPPVGDQLAGLTGGAVQTHTDLDAANDAATRALEDRVAQAQGLDPDQARRDRDEFDRIVSEDPELAGIDWSDPEAWSRPPEPPAPAGLADRIVDLIKDAGANGISPAQLRQKLAGGDDPILISRDTLHRHLRDLHTAGVLHKPHGQGRWVYREPDPGTDTPA